MTQEKQTSIRILQSKPAKKTLGKSSVFLLGLIAGMVISAIFFFVFININPTENTSTNTDSVATQEPELRDVHAEETATNHHDENAGAYKQHINEKDFNQIFKHENKVAAQKNPNLQHSNQYGYRYHDVRNLWLLIISLTDQNYCEPLSNKHVSIYILLI